MNLCLTRTYFRPDGVFGVICGSDGVIVAHTLEHSYDLAPKLPEGTYKCVRGQHQLAGHPDSFITFEITGVPGHTSILFHCGNVNADSEGCVLLGSESFTPAAGLGSISESRAAFEHFMALQNGLADFELIVKNSLAFQNNT